MPAMAEQSGVDACSVRVKICGITSAPALQAAVEAGANYIGLVCYPKSPRHLEMPDAGRIAGEARGRISIVSLLVDPDDETLTRTLSAVRPDLIQLHGGETPARVADIKARFHLPIIKAVRIGHARDVDHANGYTGIADIILFDAKPPEAHAALPGGTGHSFDWRLIAGWKGRPDFMLSGGLNPDNVQPAINTTGATAVDVSSGVETAPGVKSPELIRRFVFAARNAPVQTTADHNIPE
jgi:phosphoribosylanthranilate isomerase